MKAPIRLSAWFKAVVFIGILVSYGALAASVLAASYPILGFVFVGAFVGALGALGYLVAANREIERQFRRT